MQTVTFVTQASYKDGAWLDNFTDKRGRSEAEKGFRIFVKGQKKAKGFKYRLIKRITQETEVIKPVRRKDL